jgi:pyruvate dehydrogenase E2 component (dihydrolipoamide acetyltransferase)
VEQFDAIINAPQCAILAVGKARPKMIVADDGAPRAATMLRVTLSIDHRAIDGATGAGFLNVLRERLQHPEQFLGP